jgi:glycosyltransferase involved in cell wall biosynthesis
MSFALPVVGTQVVGIVDVVEPGRSGWLVPSRHPDALAEAILHLARQPDLRRRLGRNARLRIASQFREDQFLRRMAAFYERVWAGR